MHNTKITKVLYVLTNTEIHKQYYKQLTPTKKSHQTRRVNF